MDKSPIKHEPHVERFERFESLSAGEFWKAVSEDTGHDKISTGEILLITNIDYVDNEAHTVSVRIHPSKQSQFGNDVAKYRVPDFLTKFEHVEQETAKTDREKRLKEIQSRIDDTQKELVQASADTNVLDALIERDSPKENKQANMPMVRESLPTSVVGAIRTQKVTALMSKGLNDTGVQQIKSAMNHQVEVLQKRSGWLQNKTSQLTHIASEMTPYFKEQAAIALAETSEMRAHIDKLMKGIGSLDLYTLKDVDIIDIAKGQSAPSNVKLTITQSVLYMDEELAVYAPVHSGFDCRSRDLFFEHLSKNSDLINQIFPTERCVVGMATTRHRHDYSSYHPMHAQKLEEGNALVFFMVRDGDNIYGVISSNVMHQFCKRLFPSLDEMQAPFRGTRGEDITYESIQYTKSLNQFELMSLTYKRILILLCGLDHGRQLFGQFYEENASLEFVTQVFQQNHMNFIYDDDGTNMLKPSNKQAIEEWKIDINSQIGAGSRVLLYWRDCFSHESIPSAYERDSIHRHRNETRYQLYSPTNEVDNEGYIEAVVEVSQGERYVSIPLIGKNNRFKKREFNGRLNIDKALRETHGGYSLLCLDRIVPEDLRYYLHNRAARTLNVAGIEAIKAALAIVNKDYAEEAVVRAKLYQALQDGGVAHATDALKIINDAIAKFRCAHRGAKLEIVLSDDKKYHQLLNQLFALSKQSKDRTPDIIGDQERLGRTVLRVTIDDKGNYIAYSEPLSSERDDRLVAFAWMVKTRYKLNRKGVKAQKPTFIKLVEKPTSETVTFEVDNISEYVFPTEHPWKTPNAKAKLFQHQLSGQDVLSMIERSKHEEDAFDELLDCFLDTRIDISNSMVSEPVLAIPLATVISKKGKLGLAVAAIPSIKALIFLCHGKKERLTKAKRAYVSLYNNKSHASKKWSETVDKQDNELLSLVDLVTLYRDTPLADDEFWLEHSSWDRMHEQTGRRYSIQNTVERSFGRYELAIGDASGIDALLGCVKPDNYSPCILKKHGNGLSSDFDGYVLYDLTETLASLLNNDNSFTRLSGISMFDTVDDAKKYVSRSSRTLLDGIGNKEEREVGYVSTDEFPRTWRTNDRNEHTGLMGWKLDMES